MKKIDEQSIQAKKEKKQQNESIQELLKIIIQKGGHELINNIMETVAAYYRADRCYIFEEDSTGRFMVNTFEWCAHGIKPEKDNLQEVPIEAMNPWLDEFKKQGTFYLNCDDEYAKQEPLVYEVLEPQNIQSLMAAPMVESGLEIGFLGVDNPKENIDHTLYLSIAATSAYHELRSIHEKEQVEHGLRRNNLIQEFVKAGQWSYKINANGKVVSVTYDNVIEERTDISKHTEPMGWTEIVHPEDRDRVVKLFMNCIHDVSGNTPYEATYRVLAKDGSYRWNKASGRLFAEENGTFELLGVNLDIHDQFEEQRAYQIKLENALYASKAANQEIEAIHLTLGSGDWKMQFNERGEMLSCTWSEEFRRMLGYESLEDFPDELESWSNLLNPEDKERTLTHYWDVVNDRSGKKTYNVEYRLMTKNRGERWFRAIGRLTRREDGTPITFYGIFLNIDEEMRNKIAEKSRNSEILEAVSQEYHTLWLITAKDMKMHFIRSNGRTTIQNAVNMGKGEANYDEAITKYIDTYIVESDRERVSAAVKSSVIVEEVKEQPIYAVNYLRRDDAGNVTNHQMAFAKTNEGFILAYRDIESIIRQEKEQEKIRNKEEHETLGVIEALSYEYGSVFLLNVPDNSYRTIRVNDTGASIVSTYAEAQKALYSYVDAYVVKEDQKRMHEVCTFAKMEKNVPAQGLYSTNFLRDNGSGIRHFQMNVARFSGDDGTGYFVVGFRDISATVEKEILAQKALQEAYDTAEAASHAKSNFLQTMSHDIRTPMNGIIGMTAIAAAHIDDKERVQDCLQKITSASHHLLSLINEVLDMSKIESGKVSLSEEEFNLSDLIDNLVTMVKPQIEERQHELKVHIQNVTHELVVGDPLHIQQAFVNIMSNAVKYTPNGGLINLNIREIPCNQKRVGCYEFVFKDNGIGMSEEYIEHIFEPFTRAEDGRISKVQGTGLGMPITKNIVNMMGGDIKIESKLNKGSTFIVTIFLKLQDTYAKDNDKFADLSVLVADDDEMSLDSTVDILLGLGMQAEGVLSGEAALEKVVDHHEEKLDYNAVILDWKMPGMDGVETARAIRTKVGQDVPIIILSAYDWTDIESEAREAGVNAFISKPLFKSRLERVFDELLDDKQDVSDMSDLQNLGMMDLSAYRCLLVEDNELNAEIAQEILEETGMKVEHVWDGAQAVEAVINAEDGKYDLILMDIQMPKMNGYDATRAIRASKRKYCKTVPIIAMTANAFAEDVQAARTAGMNEHIAKPIDLKILAKIMDKWLLNK